MTDEFDVEGLFSNLDDDAKLQVVRAGVAAMRQVREGLTGSGQQAPNQQVDVAAINRRAQEIAKQKGVVVSPDDPEFDSISWTAVKPENFLKSFEQAHDAKATREEVKKKNARLVQLQKDPWKRTTAETNEARQIVKWLNEHDRGGKK